MRLKNSRELFKLFLPIEVRTLTRDKIPKTIHHIPAIIINGDPNNTRQGPIKAMQLFDLIESSMQQQQQQQYQQHPQQRQQYQQQQYQQQQYQQHPQQRQQHPQQRQQYQQQQYQQQQYQQQQYQQHPQQRQQYQQQQYQQQQYQQHPQQRQQHPQQRQQQQQQKQQIESAYDTLSGISTKFSFIKKGNEDKSLMSKRYTYIGNNGANMINTRITQSSIDRPALQSSKTHKTKMLDKEYEKFMQNRDAGMPRPPNRI